MERKSKLFPVERIVHFQIQLVNLILDREIVRELMQQEYNFETVKSSLKNILEGLGREDILNGYSELMEKIGGAGASKKVAELVVGRMKSLENQGI